MRIPDVLAPLPPLDLGPLADDRPAAPKASTVIPVRTVSEANTRGHWGKKAGRAKEQRGLARVFCGAQLDRPAAMPAAVRLTRISPGKLDSDNLASALKAVRDGVADWLGVNDGDERVTWLYAQERGPAKTYRVRVEIIGGATP